MNFDIKLRIITTKPWLQLLGIFILYDSLNLLFPLDKKIYIFELVFFLFIFLIKFRLVYFSNDFVLIITPFKKNNVFYSEIKQIIFNWNTIRGEEGYCMIIYTSKDEFLIKKFLTKSEFNKTILFLESKNLSHKIIDHPYPSKYTYRN